MICAAFESVKKLLRISILILLNLFKECNNIFLGVKQAPFKTASASNLSHENSFLQTKHLSTVVEDKSRFSEDDNEVPEADRYIHKSEVERFMIDSMVKVGTERNRAEMLAANFPKFRTLDKTFPLREKW